MSEMKSGNTNTKFNSIGSICIKVLVGVLLLEALIWAIMALSEGSSTTSSSPYVGVAASYVTIQAKMQMTFWATAGALAVAVLGFRFVEKSDGLPKIFGFVALGAEIASILLQLLVIWELVPFLERTGGGMYTYSYSYSVSIMGKLMLASTATTIGAVVAGLIMRIEENGDSIAPLKITSLVCGGITWLITLILIFGGLSDAETLVKTTALSGVALSCLIVSVALAVIMSWLNRRDAISDLLNGATRTVNIDTSHIDGGNVVSEPVQNIEMKSNETSVPVNDYMMQKTAAQKAKAEREDLPPLQSEDMAPTVERDNEIKLGPSS